MLHVGRVSLLGTFTPTCLSVSAVVRKHILQGDLVGERSPVTRRPLSRVGLAVIGALPTGKVLDQVIRVYRPRPEALGAPPTETLLAELNRERNLYGACLLAANGDPAGVLKSPNGSKERVQRALAHNPRLSPADRKRLVKLAMSRKSAALGMALIEGSERIVDTLLSHREILDLVSVRAGQQAPGLVANNLRHATLDDLRAAVERIEGGRNGKPETDAVLKNILSDASGDVLACVEQRKITIDVERLAAFCELGKAAYYGNLTLPDAIYQELENLTGRVLLPITRVFTVDRRRGAAESDPLGDAWQYSPESAAAVELASMKGYRSRQDTRGWSLAAIEGTGEILASRITELEQLETFEALLPEWSGTLGELIDTAVLL